MKRWKNAGKINATADPDKLEINAIKSAKCGIKIAGVNNLRYNIHRFDVMPSFPK